MANPRKFSEKIALHTQKQAEETAAFEAILKEVSSTTRQATKPQLQHLAQPSIGAYRGRSLPDVNQMSSGTVDLQSALSSLESMRQTLSGQPPPDKTARARNQQPQKKFSLDRHRDCSPYGSVYLSPPETSWRRSSSDSALHASVQASAAPDSFLSGSTSLLMNGQSDVATGQSGPMDTGQFWVNSKDGRPRSCEVPGISIYPSPDQGSTASHVPISNNTGSLPDLANLNFPPPLSTPLDVETQNELQEQQQQQQQQQHHPQKAMRNTLPWGMTIQPSQHQRTTGIPMVMDSTQQQMISMPHMILQGSNHLLFRGGGTGGKAILAQDNRFMSSLPGLSPDLPTPPPPPYPSSTPQVMSPPPMITITDETLNGDDGQVLFDNFEQCLSKENGPFSYFSFGNNTACNVPSRSTDGWENASVSSAANMPTSLPYQSWPANALDLAPQPSGQKVQQFSQSTSPNQGTDSFKGTAHHPVRSDTVSGHSSTTKLSAKDTANADKQKGLPLIQPISQYQAGITDLRTTSPQSSQSHNSYCSPSRSLGMSSASVTLPAVGQTMSDIIYHPHMVVSGPTMIYSEPQSLNSMFFNLSQVSRQQQQQPSNGQQLQQNLILQQSCQQFGTKPVSGNIAMYTIPSVQQQQQQQQQPVILPSSNLVLMQTNTTTSSASGAMGQQLHQQPEHLLYQDLLQSMNSQWNNSNQQLPRPGAVGQLPVSHPQHQQPVQYTNSRQPMSPGIPNIVLTAEDLLMYGHQTSDGKNTTANTSYGGSDPLRESLINASTYLGDSFDAADMFTAEEFLTLGLDPLELDEIQMLSDATLVTDPETEDSFRLDRV